MGVTSWLTKDTRRSICCRSNRHRRPTFTVYMHGWLADGSQVTYREDSYEGDGVFGGKDYFELVSEMNPEPPTKRRQGINLCCRQQLCFPRAERIARVAR
jgi:hypothetical protein